MKVGPKSERTESRKFVVKVEGVGEPRECEWFESLERAMKAGEELLDLMYKTYSLAASTTVLSIEGAKAAGVCPDECLTVFVEGPGVRCFLDDSEGRRNLWANLPVEASKKPASKHE